MYVHQHQLRHLLKPEHYTDERHHRVEIDKILRPAWHVVAVRAEVPGEGDFRTLDLLGTPVLLRNSGGRILAFVNVCAHRHCLLTHEPRGRMERLRCQYHGWEYDDEGRTGRIPDARCFRPFDRDNAHLRKLACQTIGELVFVSLADDPPPLDEFLGPFADFAREEYSSPFRFAWKWEAEYSANWKIPLENSLEAYHVPCLHAATFGDHPPEEVTDHVLEPGHSILQVKEPPGIPMAVQNWLVRRVGARPTNLYSHRLLHPNLVLVSMDALRSVQVFLPTSPTTCRHQIFMFTLRGRRKNPLAYLAYRILRAAVVTVTRKVAVEDRSIFQAQQGGMTASRHPGVIGSLEERVYVFQDFIRAATDPHPTDVPSPASA